MRLCRTARSPSKTSPRPTRPAAPTATVMQRPDAIAAGRLRIAGRLGFLLLLLIPLAACAPALAPPGPGLTAAGFSGPALPDDSFKIGRASWRERVCQ